MVSAIEKGKKAADSNDWMEFSKDLFQSSKSVVTSFLANNGTNPNSTISARDDLLLAFTVIESQISDLYSEAMFLLTTVNEMIDGILNVHQQTLNSDILTQKTTEKMVDKINKLYWPEQKVATSKVDLMNDNIGILRWVSKHA